MSQIRIVTKQKRLRGQPQLKQVANESKGLHGRPRVRMKLGRRYVENPKESHRELIKRKGNMQVCKNIGIHIKEVLGTIFFTLTNTLR